MKTKPLFFSVVLLASLCTTPCLVHAGSGDGNNGKGKGNGGSEAPIDGGLSLLLAAGIGAGAKKAYDKRKAKGREITA